MSTETLTQFISPEQFLKEARARINDDPMSRLSAPARTAIDDPDCIFDVHCHIFDKKCLNIRYLALRFAGSFIGDLLGFESTGELGQQTNHLKKDEETLLQRNRSSEPVATSGFTGRMGTI